LGTISVVIGAVVCIGGFLVMALLLVLVASELLVRRDD
jgi:hypothetical protein